MRGYLSARVSADAESAVPREAHNVCLSVESIACIIPPALHQLIFLHDDLQSPLALVGILATYNLGTFFAAAFLSKDTNNSSKAELTDEYTHKALSTQTDVESIEIVRTRGSRLSLGESFCTTDGERYRLRNKSFLTIGNIICQKMIIHCPRGNTVDLKRTWKNGVISRSTCLFKSGTICKTSQSESKDSGGKSFLVQDLVAYCSISGYAVA